MKWITVLIMFLLVSIGCASIDEQDFLEIWNETVDCYSSYLGQDLNNATTIPDFMIVDFQVCRDLPGNINGCTWIQPAKNGDKILVGRKGGSDIFFIVGVDIPLHHTTDITGVERHYIALILEERDKNFEGLTYHEVTHAVLGQIFEDANTQTLGFYDIDANHDSLFFSKNTPCRSEWELLDFFPRNLKQSSQPAKRYNAR